MYQGRGATLDSEFLRWERLRQDDEPVSFETGIFICSSVPTVEPFRSGGPVTAKRSGSVEVRACQPLEVSFEFTI